MGLIDFRKFISKKDISAVIQGLLNAMDNSVAIQDFEGNVIMGTDGGGGGRYPLELEGELIGWVQGESGATALATLLRYLLEREFEKKSLVNESSESIGAYNKFDETVYNPANVLAETIEMRDSYTGGHNIRVMHYSQAIGERMGLEEAELTMLRLAAILHDIGKISIRDNVLLKNSQLTDEEFAIIKKHTEYGAEILKHLTELKNIVPGVRGHHERYDGFGYPDRLHGEDVSLSARIIAVADSFDAMTSDRPYRKGLGFEVALEELGKHSGTQFDPEVVAAFIRAYEDGHITPTGGDDDANGNGADAD